MSPNLARIAHDYLGIPATSVPSEQAFSQAGEIISRGRNRIEGQTMRALRCLKLWMHLHELKQGLEEEITETFYEQLEDVEDSEEDES